MVQNQDHNTGDNNGLFEPQRKGCHRLVELVENAAYGVFLLWSYLPPDEKCHKHRRQGHGKKGGKEHGKGLGICQRLEEPSGLGLEGKDRQKPDGDDKEREEE